MTTQERIEAKRQARALDMATQHTAEWSAAVLEVPPLEDATWQVRLLLSLVAELRLEVEELRDQLEGATEDVVALRARLASLEEHRENLACGEAA